VTTSTATRLAALPRVNLLPPEIEEQRRFRRVQVGLGAAVAAAVGAVGLLYLNASTSVSEARAELDAARAQTATLNTETARFAHVPRVYAQVAASEAMLSSAMGKEVRWSYYLNDLSRSIPPRVWLTQITVTENVEAAANTGAGQPASNAGQNALVPPGIGQITFRGTADRHDDVARWLETLARQRGYANASFSTSTERFIDAHKVVDFSSTVTLTDKALSGRYTKPAGS
jgi:Tfp pilus assembly protein PilN